LFPVSSLYLHESSAPSFLHSSLQTIIIIQSEISDKTSPGNGDESEETLLPFSAPDGLLDNFLEYCPGASSYHVCIGSDDGVNSKRHH
jgi:hypothetical protein